MAASEPSPGAGISGCRPWPEQVEGPYHRDVEEFRADVVDDRVGVPLRLAVRLVGADGRTALAGAVVEIWQCDAAGRYSGFPPPEPGVSVTSESAPRTQVSAEERFLRGRQYTDATGTCEFRTIYPGWYPGRTVHIHLRAHVEGRAFTTQLYFPETVTGAVFSRPPYDRRPQPDTTNATDSIFSSGGRPAVVDVSREGGGYGAEVCLALAP